jgi:hypothetical protein
MAQKFDGRKKFTVTEDWRIGNCKMQKGDKLKVLETHSGRVSDWVVFKNERLPDYVFTSPVWLFRGHTEVKRRYD